MKIGIVSLFGNENFGNKLQNYALQQVLQSYADSVITIKNKSKSQTWKDYVMRQTPLAESVILNTIAGKRRKVKFLRFANKHIIHSKHTYPYDANSAAIKKEDGCDLYCAGSDQVWHPDMGSNGMFHYLGFADKEKTFSYAASFGIDRITEEHKDTVRKGLQHIKYISVREDEGKNVACNLTGRDDIQVVIDPTMLLTTEQWDLVAEAPDYRVPEKYILTYFLGHVSPERHAMIQKKAEKTGCEVVALMDKNSPYYISGPGEFLFLIKHAQYICTDSFHGSVFSFLYGKSFAVFSRDDALGNTNSRLKTLLKKFQLEHRFVQDNVLPDGDEIDYTLGYAVLKEERKKSKVFLDMVMQEINR